MEKVQGKRRRRGLPPDAAIRLKLVDYIFGGLTAQEFIEWLKNYRAENEGVK